MGRGKILKMQLWISIRWKNLKNAICIFTIWNKNNIRRQRTASGIITLKWWNIRSLKQAAARFMWFLPHWRSSTGLEKPTCKEDSPAMRKTISSFIAATVFPHRLLRKSMTAIAMNLALSERTITRRAKLV